ncbi:putative lipoprotein [Burkholderia plantarii]|uniref:Putative lipoprotein n=1 Tax=Burkholderia plantarii TaxID=41899 RepID=A0A0B6SCI5_BURPL|nr:putative lipoprotein [Burkholderia plantarii]
MRAMRWLRTLLVLLLCTVLPLSGLAASGFAGACPMRSAVPSISLAEPGMHEADGMRAGASIANPSAMPPARGGKHEAGGKPCRICAQCQSGSLHQPPVHAGVSRRAVHGVPVRFHYTDFLRTRDPNGLWRPPRPL